MDFLVILYIASTSTAFLIKDWFKFSQIHVNKPILDFTNSYTFEELGLEKKRFLFRTY